MCTKFLDWMGEATPRKESQEIQVSQQEDKIHRI